MSQTGAIPASERGKSSGADHLVHFYESDEFLTSFVANFLSDGIGAGDALVVIATQHHSQALQARLEAQGVDVASLCTSGQLTLMDANDTLASFMRNGQPDRDLFERSVGVVIAKLLAGLAGRRRLRAYGEMVDILWTAGQRDAAIRLEELWNDLQRRHAFPLLCAYAIGNFYKEPADLRRVCTTHTHVVGAGFATSLPEPYVHRLAKEIVQREEMEKSLRASLRELREKEAALRQSDEQCRDFVENANIGLHRVGPDGTILWVNRAELELLGYSEDEYVGRSIADFHVDQPVIDDILARLLRGESLHNHEARLRAKDGSIKHVLINSSVYRRDGNFIHSRCFTHDITERRKAEEALFERERQLQIVTDALPTLVAFVDDQQRYRFVSAAYERWFGHRKADVVGKHLAEVLGRDAYEAIRPHVESALSGKQVSYEAEIPYRDGGTRFIGATYIPQRESDGSIAGFVALVADISERKSFERFRADAATRSERLLKITAAIANAVSSDQVFEALVDHVGAAVGATSAALWLVHEQSGTAKLARAWGYSDESMQMYFTMSLESTNLIPPLECIRTRQPIWISSRAELFARYPHLRLASAPVRSSRGSCLPLIAPGRVLGALALTMDENSEDDRDFLLLVARYASQALERLRLFDAERRSRDEADAAAVRLGVVSHATRAFVATGVGLESRLWGVVVGLGKTLRSAVEIALVRPDHMLHTAAVYHPDPEAQATLQALGEAFPTRKGEGIAGTVAATGQSVLIQTIDQEQMLENAVPAYRTFFERYPIHALICAPLRADDRIIGTVTATQPHGNAGYTTQDLRLLENLADRAAVAIQGSRFHQEAREVRARAEQLYRFAQAVVSADRVEEVFDAALLSIEAALGTKRAAILTFESDGVMRFKAWHNLSDAYRSAVEGHSPWAPGTLAPEPILVPDAASDPAMADYLPLFEREGIRALAFIPLVTRGVLIGKFMVYFDEPRALSPQEVATAQAIANHLASVVTRFNVVAKLEETIRSNEIFAGALAHDMRNPLNAIMTAAQLLLMRHEGESSQADQSAKPLSRILASGQRMTTMIAQLLDFTSARSGGGIDVHPTETNLADLCAQAIGELELAHPEWKIHCNIVGDQGGTWDADRLLQVISNLVANAGQHGTPEGAIMVKLDGTHADQVIFQVHNKGAVPESLLPQLFDPFRSTRHRRDQSRGLGLGLFIVREVVRAHGGTVEVASSEADGTTFTVKLPRVGAVERVSS